MKKITIRLLALLGFLCISASVMAQEDFIEGLVLYLPLNEDEGEEAIDASGNGSRLRQQFWHISYYLAGQERCCWRIQIHISPSKNRYI